MLLALSAQGFLQIKGTKWHSLGLQASVMTSANMRKEIKKNPQVLLVSMEYVPKLLLKDAQKEHEIK